MATGNFDAFKTGFLCLCGLVAEFTVVRAETNTARVCCLTPPSARRLLAASSSLAMALDGRDILGEGRCVGADCWQSLPPTTSERIQLTQPPPTHTSERSVW